MPELSSWDQFLQKKSIEESEKEDLCLVNSLQWVIEDLVKDSATLARIDFEKIRNLRRSQLDRNSLLQQRLRDAWASFQGVTATSLNIEAEKKVIQSMVDEVIESTGINLFWSQEFYEPRRIDELTQKATLPNTVCILLTPGHAEPLFPQPSLQELATKLESGSGYESFGGNIILLQIE